MYKLFDFQKRDCIVQGYHFPCENPNHVVCLIHGIGEHAGRFSRVAEHFNEAGIAVVSMDLRGHGRSQGVRGACAPRKEVLKDIDALIEYAQEFYPGVPIVMYGHSMGGNITLRPQRCAGRLHYFRAVDSSGASGQRRTFDSSKTFNKDCAELQNQVGISGRKAWQCGICKTIQERPNGAPICNRALRLRGIYHRHRARKRHKRGQRQGKAYAMSFDARHEGFDLRYTGQP